VPWHQADAFSEVPPTHFGSCHRAAQPERARSPAAALPADARAIWSIRLSPDRHLQVEALALWPLAHLNHTGLRLPTISLARREAATCLTAWTGGYRASRPQVLP